jgi:putative aminopeptidase FrvX
MGSGRPARVTAAPTDIEKILALARKHSIASQFGVTGGGNDGAVFLRHGASNLAIGWPLRYSHTPAEVVD